LVQKYSVFECVIHCDKVRHDRNTTIGFRGPSPECDHDRNVCGPCFKEMFEIAIKGGRLDDLKCPDPECRKPVSLDAVRSSVSNEIFKVLVCVQEIVATNDQLISTVTTNNSL
jgi:hypothetical protein